jgi:hypothetical protein
VRGAGALLTSSGCMLRASRDTVVTPVPGFA